jgi:hypothetical protein
VTAGQLIRNASSARCASSGLRLTGAASAIPASRALAPMVGVAVGRGVGVGVGVGTGEGLTGGWTGGVG